jgi:hypothetical protein
MQQRRLISKNKTEYICSLCLRTFDKKAFEDELDQKRQQLLQKFEHETADQPLSKQMKSHLKSKIKRLSVDDITDLLDIQQLRNRK